MADSSHGLDLSKDDNRKKSRKGSIPRNVATYLKSASWNAFADEMRKLAEGVDDAEVEEAIKKLQKPKPWKNIAQTALMAGAAAPVIDLGGKFTKGFVDSKTPGFLGRVGGGLAEAGKATAGDLAAKSLTSGAGGAVLAAAKENLELHQARKALQQRILQEEPKLAGDAKPPGSFISGPSSGPKASTPSAPAAPNLGVLRGSSNKSQRVGNTPIAAKSGVTRSISSEAVNPRTSLSAAMKPRV